MTEEQPGGYAGKILRVNLTSQKTTTEKLDEKFCRKYIGGAGFIAYYLYQELKPGADPLGPDNRLVFALGPLTGTILPGSGRNCIGAKSPLTGGIIKSEVGGFWGTELKRAGFDGIIVEGKAEKPVYLWIQDNKVEIRDASHLWGKETKETLDTIREELGDRNVRVAHIGPGGENLVRYACIMNGLQDAAGRGGIGAVMGSKNLKAIAVRGHQKVKVLSSETMSGLRQWLVDNKRIWAGLAEGTAGTGAIMEAMVKEGNLSVNNFSSGIFPDAIKVDAASCRIKMEACYGCPIRCKKVLEVNEGPYLVDPAYGGPEYETMGSLGTNCGISDIRAIAHGNQICNANSLDTISAGMVISFAMECFENGLLTPEDTGGIELRFGNADAMIKVLKLIARREGIGNLLAEGVRAAAAKIGRGAEKYALHVKGLEIPMHEPRLKPGLGLGYMVGPQGADHIINVHDTLFVYEGMIRTLKPLGVYEPLPLEDIGPRKVALVKLYQLGRLITDCLAVCHFVPFTYRYQSMAEATAEVTGWSIGVIEQFAAAERILTMFRLINIREGITAEEDKLPERFYESKSGALEGKHLDREEMEKAREYYYTIMGWDPKTGIPLEEKVEELGIP